MCHFVDMYVHMRFSMDITKRLLKICHRFIPEQAFQPRGNCVSVARASTIEPRSSAHTGFWILITCFTTTNGLLQVEWILLLWNHQSDGRYKACKVDLKPVNTLIDSCSCFSSCTYPSNNFTLATHDSFWFRFSNSMKIFQQTITK